MTSQARPLVLDKPFEQAVAAVNAVLRDAGFHVMARVDLRDDMRRLMRHDFRQYLLLTVATPGMLFESLRRDLAIGPFLPATVAVYELADGETAVVASIPSGALLRSRSWKEAQPRVAALAAKEAERLTGALRELGGREVAHASAA
jgi:uncharacterized protein (DUF302 family)